ncbi:MAG: hypothetical protein ABWK05_06745 [Pyrobaculum sp.]
MWICASTKSHRLERGPRGRRNTSEEEISVEYIVVATGLRPG